MAIAGHFLKALMVYGAVSVAAAQAVEVEKPVGGKQVRFEQGLWAGVPQVREGQVSQCVLVAKRARAGKDGPVDTVLGLTISRGSGFVLTMRDEAMPGERIMDDQAEIVLDAGKPFPATGFDVTATSFAFHPGDAAAVLTGLEKAKSVQLRSAGAGIDSGPITINLPAAALAWLKECGKTFDIALDRPTDPRAPELPTPRPRSPDVAPVQASAAGPAGIEDRQKISGWDASELRGPDGKVMICMIRRHYTTGVGKDARQLGTFLMASRIKGLVMMLKDSGLDRRADEKIEATLSFGGRPFTDFTAQMLSKDEIGIFPQHSLMLARALDEADRFDFKSKVAGMEFPVRGAMAWLRACARRHKIGLAAGQ